MTNFSLEHPITSLPRVGPENAKRLARLEIKTIFDLLNHFPRRYEDWTAFRSIKSLRIGEMAVIRATIKTIEKTRSPRQGMSVIKALLTDESGEMLAVWFNQPYLVNFFKVGVSYYFRGSVGYDRSGGYKQLVSPDYERIARVLPIYPVTAHLTSKQIRYLMQFVLPLAGELPDPLPPQIVVQEKLLPRSKAILTLHQPASIKDISKAEGRLAFEELYLFSLRLLLARRRLQESRSPVIQQSDDQLKAFVTALPFNLTNAQRRAAWQIIRDLSQDIPMNRLLEGDVGSGKTVVAAFAAYLTSLTDYQTIWLAPTELLAEQHHQTLSKLLQPFNIPVDLCTQSQKIRYPISDIRNLVVIGTHAILSRRADFTRLGLVIIDEQHRFGVEQRALLRTQVPDRLMPHFLSMSATPIPRTLALALFGDLSHSILNEIPSDRSPIITRIIKPDERPESYQYIRQEIKAGRQGYVVCPLIEPTEENTDQLFSDLEQKSAVQEFERLKTEIFPDLCLGLVHGRLKSAEKQKVMHEFKEGKIDLLVSTAVIEVGIDVPNATVMLIEGADRFGLAALHQLRGRVGRGRHQSTCLLASGQWNKVIADRLTALVNTNNGFELAEIDLRLRGPGQFLGTDQSGLLDFKFASPVDLPLIERARQAAKLTLEQGLTSPIIDEILKEAGDRLEHLE